MRALAVLLLMAACAPAVSAPPVTAPVSLAPSAEPKRPPEPRIARFTVGTLEAYALKDGDLHEKNDAQTFGLGRAPTEIDALLGRPTPTIDLSIQPLLVRDGERILLFDTGALRPSWAPEAGALLPSFALARIAPASVTDIFISHHHDDHVGGLVDGRGQLAFPNARIHMSAPEWATMQATKEQADLVDAIASRVVPFQLGAELLPSVRAVNVAGHTPGHSAYEIRSGAARLLYIGDSAHHSIISVRRPLWPVDYDGDKPVAARSREALLTRLAAEQLHIYGVHFPFPGLGTITRTQDGFAFVAENALPPSPPALPDPVSVSDLDEQWREAHGVTAWPPSACTGRALNQIIDECQCTRTLDIGKTSYLFCQRPAPPSKGTGIQVRTLLLAPSGKNATVAFDQVTAVGEDDPLPGGIGGVQLDLEADGDALVLRDRGNCPDAIAAVTQTARANPPASPWSAEVTIYRATCARAGRYMLDHGTFRPRT